MKKLVKPSEIKGRVVAPASKSMMQRSIAVAMLAQGKSTLLNYTSCKDSDAALQIARDMGCEVSVNGRTVIIDGGMRPKTNQLNCGEAGLGIRMFTPIASLLPEAVTLHGEGSLKTRPVTMLEAPMRGLGVDITTTNGCVPITVKGPLKGGKAEVDGSVSSQMLTGLLIALPLAPQASTLSVLDLKSKPYIDMTIQVLKSFGVEVTHANYETFSIAGGQSYKPSTFNVEGDWSGASFLLVAGAIGGSVLVENVDTASLQADLAILKAIEQVGAKIEYQNGAVQITKDKLNAFEFDANECPDLFPPLVAMASHCTGTTRIKGVGRLKHKESDRASVLRDEFAKLGVVIEIEGDLMRVHGGTLKGGKIIAHNDHRIAMAGAVAAICAKESIEIDNAECIAKSYPQFYDDFASIGGCVSSIE